MPVDSHQLELFFVTALLLVITPGVDTVLVLSKSIVSGRSGGIITTIGITFGNIIHSLLAASGLSALIHTSQTAFIIITYMGAAWLAWLGIGALRTLWSTNNADQASVVSAAELHPGRVFVLGMATNLLNVQVLLINVAIIPEFVVPKLGSVSTQVLIFGAIYTFIEFVFLLVLSFATSAFRDFLSSKNVMRFIQSTAGVVFIIFAIILTVR